MTTTTITTSTSCSSTGLWGYLNRQVPLIEFPELEQNISRFQQILCETFFGSRDIQISLTYSNKPSKVLFGRCAGRWSKPGRWLKYMGPLPSIPPQGLRLNVARQK